MANRQVRLLTRNKQTTGGNLPSNALMGEAFVNLYDGILKFSGVTGGGYEPSSDSSVFEVGSTLYNSKITNRLSVNNNFIVSGNTGIISKYNGLEGSNLNGKFLSGTTLGFVLGNISDIQGVNDITRVQQGTNITTGGTPNNPIVNVVPSPSFNNIFFSGVSTGGDSVVTNMSATTIYSGSTDVSSLFKDWTLKTDFNSHTGNTSNPHQVTASQVGAYTTSQTNSLLNTKANLSGATFTGAINALTIQSGGTDLYNIFVTEDTIDITRVQPGTNITTGGTANNPIVNVVSSPSFNNIFFSGVSTGGDSVVTNMSATTIYSGSTDVSSLFKDWTLKTDFNSHTGNTSNPHQVTASQVGAYTTSQTNSLLNTKANLSGATFTGTINAPTIQSGGTDLYNIFVTEDTIDITRVQPGTNITTGGTANNPIVNVVSSPSFAGVVSSAGYEDSSLTQGRVAFVGSSGRIVDESSFTYDSSIDTLNTQNIVLGSPGKSGTTATIYGDILVIGESISGFTSELYIEDNLIELNYNPTASTVSTSLGAGWAIQDGSGVAGTDVLWDIRGASTGLSNRSFATNLEDIRIRETGTISSPNGVRVIAEQDVVDGGIY